MREIREISANWEAFRKGLGGEVLGVNMDDDLAPARAPIEGGAVPFRSVWAGGRWGSPVAKAYHVTSIPAAVLIGPDGRIERRRAYPAEWSRLHQK